MRWLIRPILLTAMLTLMASPALAQPAPANVPDAESADVERAKVLVEEGRVLGDRSDWAGALAKFRDAGRLAESAGLRFNIAVSEEHLGKLVAALTDFRLAKREATRGGATDVSALIEARVTALEPRIASFAFQRPSSAENAAILVDGRALDDPASGRLEVDPGPHEVTALLDGVTRFDRVVTVREGESRTVTLYLEPLPVPSRLPVVGYSMGGAGLVSLGVMGVFIGLRQSALADLKAVCNAQERCPVSSQPDIDRGRLYTGVAEATGIAGALLIAGGAILVGVSPSRRGAPRETPRVGLCDSPGGAGMEWTF